MRQIEPLAYFSVLTTLRRELRRQSASSVRLARYYVEFGAKTPAPRAYDG
jgi:hypothetical protein